MRILIADDEPHVRQLLRFFLAELPDAEIVGEVTNGKSALQAIEQLYPDVVITDVRMPIMDGLEVLSQAREQGVTANFIVISGYSDFKYAKTAIHYGVEDYLLKPIDKNELFEALAKIAEGSRRSAKPSLSTSKPDSLAEAFLRWDVSAEAVTEARLLRLFHARTLYPSFFGRHSKG